MKLSKLSIEWDIQMAILVETLKKIGVPNAGPQTDLTTEQYNLLCDELLKVDNTTSSELLEGIIDEINKLGPLTARLSAYDRLVKISDVYNKLHQHYIEINSPLKEEAWKKVDRLYTFARINFKDEQDKKFLVVLEKYRDMQIKHQINEKNSNHSIQIIFGVYNITLEYNWNQKIWMSIQHKTKDRINGESNHPIFPQVNDLQPLLIDGIKFAKGEYVISSSIESWPQDMEFLFSKIKKNEIILSRVFDNYTLRFSDGTMKIRRKIWKSPAWIVGINQKSERPFIQGVKKDKQSSYACAPYWFGSNGTYVGFEDKYYVLIFSVLRPSQESFHAIKLDVNIENFIRKYYLPKLQRQKMSSKLLEEIHQKLITIKIEVFTSDFDEDGAVSVNATFLPLGFKSWEEFLKTIF